MRGFLYSAALQLKLDIRSRNLLIAGYMVPLVFFIFMGGIFTSVMPEMKNTLIQSMTVMSVSMGAFIGLPSSLAEIYKADVKKVYKVNGVPVYAAFAAMFLSSFIHTMMTCVIILLVAPALFGADTPSELPRFFLELSVYIGASLGIGSILGLTAKGQAKLTMTSQLLFLPSIMLSGIMFPAEMLPAPLEAAGRVFPAYHGYSLMIGGAIRLDKLFYLILVFGASVTACAVIIRKTELK